MPKITVQLGDEIVTALVEIYEDLLLPPKPQAPTHAPESGDFASTHYVDPVNGSDTNNGTEATPWLTLSKAASVAPAKSRVFVLPGTVTVQPIIKAARTDWVTFMAIPGKPATIPGIQFDPTSRFVAIQGDDLAFTGGMNAIAGAAKLRFRRLKASVVLRATAALAVDDVIVEDMVSRPGISHSCVTISAGDTTKRVSNVTLRRIDGVADSNDVFHFGASDRLLVEDCNLHDMLRTITTTHVDGIQFVGNSNDVMIRRCHIFNAPLCQAIFASDGTIQRFWLENNLIEGIGGGIGTNLSVGRANNDTVILFNTIRGRFRMTASASIAVLLGNVLGSIVKDAGTGPIQIERYNVIAGTYVPGPDSLSGSPTYVDQAAGDFRLAPESKGYGLVPPVLGAPLTRSGSVREPVSGRVAVGSEGP